MQGQIKRSVGAHCRVVDWESLGDEFQILGMGKENLHQKKQFSDGVGYGWIDALKDSAKLKLQGILPVVMELN